MISAEVAAHNLLVHVPPSDIEDRMYDVIQMNPSIADEILSTTDVPFQTETCPDHHRLFILCDFNRDLDSYRSPYTSKYIPDLPDGVQPPPELREMEVLAEKAINALKTLYYNKSGVGNCYTWHISEAEFGIGVFFRKMLQEELTTNSGMPVSGWINASDVFTVTSIGGGKFQYEQVSSVLLELKLGGDGDRPLCVSGSLGDKKVREAHAESPMDHVVNVFTYVEESMERFMGRIQNVYVDKTQEIFERCRIRPQP